VVRAYLAQDQALIELKKYKGVSNHPNQTITHELEKTHV